jgi:hypothetical protein
MTMATNEARQIATVGDLIDRLQAFDRNLPIRTAHAATGDDTHWEWIIAVGEIPPSRTMIGVIYMPPPAS